MNNLQIKSCKSLNNKISWYFPKVVEVVTGEHPYESFQWQGLCDNSKGSKGGWYYL